MRKISANLIFPVSTTPLINGIIILDPEGRILDLIDTGGKLQEEAGLEYYPGIIIPGFVIPWMRFMASNRFSTNIDLHDPELISDQLKRFDKKLFLKGIKGIGLVLPEDMISDVGFKIMSQSPLIYHPIIELCLDPDEEEFEVFNRGIDLVSRAWNEFNLPCSLTACSPAMQDSDIGKYLEEYSSSHSNVFPPEGKNPMKFLSAMQENQDSIPLDKWLPELTLKAAAEIIEDDELGSLEKGKKPGLILVKAYDTDSLKPSGKTEFKVLV